MRRREPERGSPAGCRGGADCESRRLGIMGVMDVMGVMGRFSSVAFPVLGSLRSVRLGCRTPGVGG